MKILGIETSCDETAAAVVETPQSGASGFEVLSSVVASSQETHVKTGGIIPENAAREQLKVILPVIEEALTQACHPGDQRSIGSCIDTIAVTTGPGLIGSLLVGVEAAKTLSLVWDKPIIPVNHIIAHIYANWITDTTPQLPAIALVVSGGHTELFHMKSHKGIKWLGGTRDDAAGEAFDKTARLLGLGYPGGPAIAKQAMSFLRRQESIQKLDLFPRPMINSNDLDFSFSGLKTSVLNYTKRHPSSRAKRGDLSLLAANVQEAIVDTLVAKSMKAIKTHKPKSFLLAGGVAANKRLREKLQSAISESFSDVKFFAPPKGLSTDNAVMIAAAAFYQKK